MNLFLSLIIYPFLFTSFFSFSVYYSYLVTLMIRLFFAVFITMPSNLTTLSSIVPFLLAVCTHFLHTVYFSIVYFFSRHSQHLYYLPTSFSLSSSRFYPNAFIVLCLLFVFPHHPIVLPFILISFIICPFHSLHRYPFFFIQAHSSPSASSSFSFTIVFFCTSFASSLLFAHLILFIVILAFHSTHSSPSPSSLSFLVITFLCSSFLLSTHFNLFVVINSFPSMHTFSPSLAFPSRHNRHLLHLPYVHTSRSVSDCYLWLCILTLHQQGGQTIADAPFPLARRDPPAGGHVLGA